MLTTISKQLDTLYRGYGDGLGLSIQTHMYLEGDPINFRFYQEDSKFSRLVTPPVFSEWMAWCTGDWKKAAPAIEALAKPYGVSWDNENGVLYLRFRRNEMTIAQAILRLQQAVAVVCALGPV
ncbi:MAG: hypothetical protein IJ043_06225 [Clostridia bacterium]|nr:hypothetical protein [Clostridia bacterium]